MTAPSAVEPMWNQMGPLPETMDSASWTPVLEVIRKDASYGKLTPLADAAIACALAGAAGLEAGKRNIAAHGRVQLRRDVNIWRVDGEFPRVPWGREAQYLIVLAEGKVLRLPVAAATVRPGANLGGEPRDALTFRDHALVSTEVSDRRVPADGLTTLGGLARATAIAGALQTVCSLVISHAGQREQFGRALDRFQAVQAHLCTITSETASADMAAEIGRRGLDDEPSFAVAVAKTRAAAAATAATRAAHQVLGAVGTTELHELGNYTRCLWSWRDEHGSQMWWRRKLGELVAETGSAGMWDLVTGAGK